MALWLSVCERRSVTSNLISSHICGRWCLVDDWFEFLYVNIVHSRHCYNAYLTPGCTHLTSCVAKRDRLVSRSYCRHINNQYPATLQSSCRIIIESCTNIHDEGKSYIGRLCIKVWFRKISLKNGIHVHIMSWSYVISTSARISAVMPDRLREGRNRIYIWRCDKSAEGPQHTQRGLHWWFDSASATIGNKNDMTPSDMRIIRFISVGVQLTESNWVNTARENHPLRKRIQLNWRDMN